MTTANKPKKSDYARKAPPRWGWVTREHLSYAIVWFAGLAIGVWLF